MRTGISVWLTLLWCLLLPPTLRADDSCLRQPLQVERLPHLHVPRSGHSVFCADDEVVVAGGHTQGFVPTPTAEYYADGAWHLMPMVYTHDGGLAALTQQGGVVVAGGFEKELGIGQTFTLELYDPATHSFSGYGCLDQKRSYAEALPLDSGNVVIAGNWYAADYIELFDGTRQNPFVKAVAQDRSEPYILRTARDNAVIFSSQDTHGQPLQPIIVDRLKGDPFTVPLFETWRPVYSQYGMRNGDAFIGDEEKGQYRTLVPATNAGGQVAVILVDGENFSLLSTTSAIPMQSQWGAIHYFSFITADRKAGRAYLTGYGYEPQDRRLYVVGIDYGEQPAQLTLYCSEPLDSIGLYNPILTPEGDLLMAGGATYAGSNFEPCPTALLLHVGTPLDNTLQGKANNTAAGSQQHRRSAWLWVLLAVGLVATGTTVIITIRRRRKHTAMPATATGSQGSDELTQRICQLMDTEQLYLNSELKVADVARRMGTNSSYVSACINTQKQCSFNQFVNSYRIAHAQCLLSQQPTKRVSEVWPVSGFSTEKSFFRTFKALTGMTPTEWKQTADNADRPAAKG